MKRVLIVEDDLACEHALRHLVHAADPEAAVESVTDAEKAALILVQESSAGRRFDLLISDIYLAGKLTGLDVWKLKGEFFPLTSVVMTSSMTLENFKAAVGENPPAFLPKPMRLSESLKILRAFLGRA